MPDVIHANIDAAKSLDKLIQHIQNTQIRATIQAIQAMKEVTASLIEPEAAKEISVYFDYICAGLKTDSTAPTYKEESVSDREQQAQSNILNYIQIWLNQLSADQKELVADKLEKAIAGSNSDSQDDLTESLIGRKLTKQERLELEFSSLLRYFNQRRKLLDGALTASQVATLLGTSRQTPHDRLKAGNLLAILDNGVWRFPLWQFDPTGPDGTIAGFPEILRSLEMPAYSQLSWLVRPNSFLNGLTPVEALKQGHKELVLHAARAVGVK